MIIRLRRKAMFFDKINRGGPDDCWPWAAATNQYGYGVFWDGEKLVLATALAYAMEKGPVPDGAHVLHHCDNPPCCNPKHLFLGTQASNMADKQSKGRQSRGEHRPAAKLTDAIVAQCRKRFVLHDPVHGVAALAGEFGVCTYTMRRVLSKKAWKHVAGGFS